MTVMHVHRQELTPSNFLERSGEVYATRTAVVDNDVSYTWFEFRARARRRAEAVAFVEMR